MTVGLQTRKSMKITQAPQLHHVDLTKGSAGIVHALTRFWFADGREHVERRNKIEDNLWILWGDSDQKWHECQAISSPLSISMLCVRTPNQIYQSPWSLALKCMRSSRICRSSKLRFEQQQGVTVISEKPTGARMPCRKGWVNKILGSIHCQLDSHIAGAKRWRAGAIERQTTWRRIQEVLKIEERLY